MAGIRPAAILGKRIAVVIVALALTGCELLALWPAVERQPVTTAPAPQRPAVVKPQPLPFVAIVMSSRQPAYRNVASALGDRLKNYTVFDMSDRRQAPVAAFRMINNSSATAVVAIGLQAAEAAIAMARMPVVFSQVFNYRDYDLLTDNSRGISTLPPLDLQIAAWKKIDPTMSSIGAIIGDGHDELIEEARLAAEKHGVRLHIRSAKSDRETMYLFNRMAGDIDGFWLFPDNRILSAQVLQQIFKSSERHRIRVTVFNESLLSMGASVSASAVDTNIADTIVKVLRRIAAGDIKNVPALSPLSDVHIVTNDAVFRKLVPAESQTAYHPTVSNSQ
ncbi:MAG: hypothetical protein IIA78_07090 [Proteobacteria bacterium]|nr:hypothetical protein [Pseudomonadota bacterium]